MNLYFALQSCYLIIIIDSLVFHFPVLNDDFDIEQCYINFLLFFFIIYFLPIVLCIHYVAL